MPVVGERFCRSCVTASRPPAEAPIATTGKVFLSIAGMETAESGKIFSGFFRLSFEGSGETTSGAVLEFDVAFFCSEPVVDLVFTAPIRLMSKRADSHCPDEIISYSAVNLLVFHDIGKLLKLKSA